MTDWFPRWSYFFSQFLILKGMKALFVLLPLLWTFLFVPSAFSARKGESASKNGISLEKDAFIQAISHQDVDNDFENGTTAPYWTDCSEDGTLWVAVDNNHSWINENGRSQLKLLSPPPPNNQGKFVIIKHYLKTFGIGILSSPYFIAYPGDRVMFSYWLQSTFPNFNNIQVILF